MRGRAHQVGPVCGAHGGEDGVGSVVAMQRCHRRLGLLHRRCQQHLPAPQANSCWETADVEALARRGS